MIKLPFGEYLPDVQPTDNPGLTVASNCLPGVTSYREVSSLVTYSLNGLDSTPLGAISARDTSGNTFTYAGDAKKLYRLSSSTWYDSSIAGISATYVTSTTGYWEFAQWGNFVLATNGIDVLQEITLGASNFSAVAGTPPISVHMGVVRDFVVLGNVTDLSSGASVPNRVHWSGFNDKTKWTPSMATQADYQDLNASYGPVQRVIGGEIGIVFQEYAITRMLYVGAPIIWQFDTVETNKGTSYPGSCVKVGGNVFYLGHDDFYMFNGSGSTPIGTGKVFNTFWKDFNKSNYAHYISGIAITDSTCVIWSYVDNNGDSKMIAYNWLSNRWAGPINIESYKLFYFLSEGYTLDSLDSFNNNIDTYAISFDDNYFMGGLRNIGVMDTNYRLSTLSGPPLTAVFETGSRNLTDGKRSLVGNVKPLYDGVSASVSVAVSSINNLKDTHSFGPDVVANSEGECPMFNEGRYHRFRVTVAGGFNHAYGLEIEGGPGGRY